MNKPVNCGCSGEPLLEPRYIRMNIYYALRCPCCGIEIKRKTESEVISAWNKAMSGNVNVLKSEYKRGYADGMAKQRYNDDVSRRWEESYRASQMPWNHYTEMGG